MKAFWSGSPGSCCSTARRCTWSPVSRCTCCSRSLPLWRTPDNTKAPALEMPICTAESRCQAIGATPRELTTGLPQSHSSPGSTKPFPHTGGSNSCRGKQCHQFTSRDTHPSLSLSLSVGCTFTGLLKRHAPPPLFRKLWNSSTLQSENFLGR